MKEKVGKGKKVALALSGGVDSAVSAALLKERGYDVTCIYMVCWEDGNSGCASDSNRVDAAKVAATLGLPLLVWDFTKEYKEKVIDYFYAEYRAGRTPNPDIMCNKEIKFGLFFEKAVRDLKVDFVATGHYARVSCLQRDGVPVCKLMRGADPTKDQSYFLYTLTLRHLSKTLFPVGNMLKTQVREHAKELKLPVWDKPDSQGICFIGKVDIRKFLEERIKPKKGNVLDVNGNMIGEHIGAWFYTIGQRHGFTITDTADLKVGRGDLLPLYVISKDVDKNTITVGSRSEAMRDDFKLESGLSQSGIIPNLGRLKVRIRHLGKLYPVENIEFSKRDVYVKLSKKAFGIAPGQSAVFYYGNEVLGGGIIS